MSERYQKGEWIGGGGYADVYKAFDTLTGKTVALKELRVPSPENRRRFKRERDMLRVHSYNPFIIDIYDWDLDAPTPYLVLEYSDLGSLEQFVKNRKHWKLIARLVIHVSCALHEVHQRQQWHRDIKPSNILLFRDSTGELIAKLTDFGIARKPDTTSGPVTDTPFGTKEYLDPVAKLNGRFTWHADIYALGKTLRELLTGDRDGGVLAPGVPIQMQVLLSSMTSFFQSYRPTAEDVVRRLDELLEAPQPAPAQTAQPTLAVQPMGWKGVVGTLIAGLALAAVVNNVNGYDENMGRYRDSKGRFRSDWWG